MAKQPVASLSGGAPTRAPVPPHFQQALADFRMLSRQQQRNSDDEAQREAMADALRSIARSEERLREYAPDEADTILQLARARDQRHADDLELQDRQDRRDEEAVPSGLEPPGSTPKLPLHQVKRDWETVAADPKNGVRSVHQASEHVEIVMVNGVHLHDTGDTVKCRGQMTPEAAKAMMIAAKLHGWDSVWLRGNQREREMMAEAAHGMGLKVNNPELQKYMRSLNRAQEHNQRTPLDGPRGAGISAEERARGERMRRELAQTSAREFAKSGGGGWEAPDDLRNVRGFEVALATYHDALADPTSDAATREEMRADLRARAVAISGDPQAQAEAKAAGIGEDVSGWNADAMRAEAPAPAPEME